MVPVPIKNKVAAATMVVTFESTIVDKALSNDASRADLIFLPDLNSSFNLSKIIIYPYQSELYYLLRKPDTVVLKIA